MRKVILRGLTLTLILAALAMIGGAVWFRMVADDPAIWHIDPMQAQRGDRVNDALSAPEGAASRADMAAPVYVLSPRRIMEEFDRMALAQPRVARIAGAPGDLWATYVQRSLLMGYPDYISVRALPVGARGSTLAIYSRSRFGRDDFGVNAARLSAWLDALRRFEG